MLWLVLCTTLCQAPLATAGGRIDTVRTTAAAAVGVGTLSNKPSGHGGQPAGRFLGSGFVIAPGSRIVTSAHVVDQIESARERLVIFTGDGERVQARPALVLYRDVEHDLAVLRVSGEPLPALSLADGRHRPVGTAVAFSGYPAGMTTGAYPITHFGYISAIAPAAEPIRGGEKLTAAQIRALRDGFLIYQMDATVLPGHSGSAVIDVETGQVIGVIVGALTRRAAFSKKMELVGMSFAIPVTYLHSLLPDASP
ncbi:S1C family serine protease [Parahaliea mediterranea]|uniref:S1C family serine protease n=1 Tax=Parahaliea mediterranea TaxID=651086 RepID=UPI0013009AD9|nr:serine protease [Parahaliea mediterranea]